MRKRRLTSLNDLRKYLAYTANQLEAGTITTDHARCVAYLCNIMSGIIQNGDLEKRVQELENRMKGGDDIEPKASSGAAGKPDSMSGRWAD